MDLIPTSIQEAPGKTLPSVKSKRPPKPTFGTIPFKLDQTFITNLLPYAVPVVGFVLTAFPSLGYWIGSLLGPIGRAVK
jgi:hypothetical protein